MASSNLPIMPKRRILPTVLNFMDGSRIPIKSSYHSNRSSNDIFDLLRRAIQQRCRIEVLTRDCRGIDGIFTGWLIAFDKHMNLIMNDVDEVFRRLTDGEDYLQFGSTQKNSSSSEPSTSASQKKTVPEDFQTFRAQLAQFLKKKKQPQNSAPIVDDDEEGSEQGPVPCRSDAFLPMRLLSVNNLSVQRLSGKTQFNDSQTSPISVTLTSKRPKTRFFSRHVPKLFIKGNQVCLIRLLNS